MTTFASFGLPSFLNESLDRMSIKIPTPIQEKAVPPGLEGFDILASAQTGTGKTIAYLLPLITNLLKDSQASALILAPTRELAAQIQQAAHALFGKNMSLNTALLIGGESMGKQLSALRRNPRLIVGTPGRINDHLQRRTLKLQETRFLVLDETDRMLDMGFTEALKKIVHYLPKERQTFMFSATMPSSIKALSMTYLTNPQHISVGSTTAPSLQVKQETLQTSANDKFPILLKELNDREGSIIIFVKTKHGADRLAEKLSNQNHPAAAIHGDLRQRKRDEVIRDFRNLKHRIVVATDVAARGLDIPHIKHVINYDLPQCPEDYIHRIGRTGRAGMEGSALSLIAPEDNQKWRRIHSLINLGKESPVAANTDTPRKRSKPRPFQKSADSRGLYQQSEGSRQGKPYRRSEDSKKDRPFHGSGDARPGKPYRNSEGSKQDRPFREFGDAKQGKPYRNSEGAKQDRPFHGSGDARPGKPYRNGEKQERPFSGSGDARPGKPYRNGSKQDRPFNGSGDARPGKPYRSSEGPKQDRPFSGSGDARPGKPYRSSESSSSPRKSFQKPTDAKRGGGGFARRGPSKQQHAFR